LPKFVENSVLCSFGKTDKKLKTLLIYITIKQTRNRFSLVLL
jgi:hypothetical protein